MVRVEALLLREETQSLATHHSKPLAVLRSSCQALVKPNVHCLQLYDKPVISL